jgi:hypothetical protein
MRTSTIAGAFGKPIRRESWATVISVGDGMASSSIEGKDAIFGLPPHGVIAITPCVAINVATERMSMLTFNRFQKPRIDWHDTVNVTKISHLRQRTASSLAVENN